MSPRTATLPITEPAMWRKLLAKVHPDAGGEHELFIWVMNLRDSMLSGGRSAERPTQDRGSAAPRGEARDSVPFTAADGERDFEGQKWKIITFADKQPEPFRRALFLLGDCSPAFDGPLLAQEARGATYKQLAAIGHLVGMSKPQRVRWYRLCEQIPLSCRHASHIIERLKEAA